MNNMYSVIQIALIASVICSITSIATPLLLILAVIPPARLNLRRNAHHDKRDIVFRISNCSISPRHHADLTPLNMQDMSDIEETMPAVQSTFQYVPWRVTSLLNPVSCGSDL